MGLAWVLDHFAEIGQYAAQQVVEGIDLGRGQTGRGFAVGVSEEIQRHRHDLLGVGTEAEPGGPTVVRVG
jgi:hypothetical protein